MQKVTIANLGSIALLWAILTSGFSDSSALGQIDKVVIALLLIRALFSEGEKVRLRSLFFVGLVVLYGLLWNIECAVTGCSGQVAGTGENILRFSLYFLIISFLREREVVQITPEVVLLSLSAFIFGLIAQGDMSLFRSLGALGGGGEFYNSYRFGIENEVNNINYTALLLATLVPFAFPRRPFDLIGILALLCIAALVVATYSRSGLALYGVMLVISGISIWGMRPTRVILLTSLCAIAFYTINSLGYFLMRSFDFIGDASIEARLTAIDLINNFQPFGQKELLGNYFTQIGAIDNALVRHIIGSGLLVLLIFVPAIALGWQAFRHTFLRLTEIRPAIAALGWLFTIVLDDQVFSLWGGVVLAWFWAGHSKKSNSKRNLESRAASRDRAIALGVQGSAD